MDTILLETKQLQKKFGRAKALSDVSLKVHKNSIYGLLGPNGAGKSTTLKLLTGILNPTSGEILFEGRKWKRSFLKEIGSLIESPPLYSNLTAFENVKVHATLLGIPDARIKEVLKIVDLEHTGKKRAGQFSMGMKQRLGIAIALLNHPTLLILDEPTNGLDPIGIQELRELIRSFPEQRMTVILSSHILSEVEQIADHIGIISSGCLGYQGKINKGDDLERLFMDVVKSTRGEEGGER
ncbi:lantibiotic protection ABC transporter ATP-binding protein [Bacillus sp. z60-18]|uniref:lantibiotic protection ABC transporter ATP-binding protein n=1 Tax=unclassified Bacillus (in: firmicutes) TaxID=185979 RepID=UPI00390C5C64